MFRNERKVVTAILVLCGVALPAEGLRAQDLGNGWEPNALELSKLPNYCQQFFLKKHLPPNCDGVHHLCAGKVLITRVTNLSIPKQERKRILGRAKQEVDYIFTRQNPSCKMMDEARAAQSDIRMLEMLVR